MNYYLLFRVRSWNNGVRCMSFYILTEMISNTLYQLMRTYSMPTIAYDSVFLHSIELAYLE